MKSNTKAKSIIIYAILIVATLLIVNIGLIIRINQLAREKSDLENDINKQNETIQKYEQSSSQNLDEVATITEE